MCETFLKKDVDRIWNDLTKTVKIKGREAESTIYANINYDNRLDQNGFDNAEVDNGRIAKVTIRVVKLIRIAAGEWSNKSVLLDKSQGLEYYCRLKM